MTRGGARGALRSRSMIATLPEAAQRASLFVGKDARAIDDGGLLRRRDGHLDDVDAEDGGVGILAVRNAAVELFAGADAAGARTVDVDVRLVLQIGNDGVCVRPAAGLHRRHLSRLVDVFDVEDADAAEALLADRVLDAVQPAVDAPSRLLHRHEQEAAVHRHVPLSAGTDD